MRQTKGETSRNFGLRALRATQEAAEGQGFPESYIMRRACIIFINGLRDLCMRERVSQEYDHRCHSIFDLFNITEQYIQREHRYATGEITAPRDCYATFCAALDYDGDEISPGGRYVASYEYYGEDEPYTDRAEIEYGIAALK